MVESNKSVDNISSESIKEAENKYKEIMQNKTVQDFMDVVDYETIENERDNIFNMSIEEFLLDWSRSGLF